MKAALDSVREHGLLLLIVAAFLALGVVYSLSTPLLEAPDEMWHYPYVKHIADGKGLPRQSAAGEKSEFFQPPLYYALAALVTWPIDTSDLGALMQPNPYWGYRARERSNDNKNIFVHTDRELGFSRGAVLAIRVSRWLSLLFGVLGVVGSYLIAREVVPARRYLAFGAAALAAFTPQFLYVSAAVNNDSLTAACCTWAIWWMLRLLRRGGARRDLIVLGALLGLAALSKWSALGLLPLGAGMLAYRAWLERSWRKLAREGILVFGLALAISGWWLARNQILYQDPLGIGRKMQIFTPRSPTPTAAELIRELPGKVNSYWASFGWENVYADTWVYTILRVFTGLGLLSLIGWLLWQWRERQRSAEFDAVTWRQLVLLGGWFVIIAILFVRWMLYTDVAVGRHLFPAIAAISLGLLLGWTGWLGARAARGLTALLAIGLFVLAAVSPFAYIQPVYAPPPRYASVAQVKIPNALSVNFADKIALLGYEMDDAAVPGQALKVTLYWRVLARMDDNYSVFVHLVGEDGALAAQRDSYPGLGNYVTSRWQVGEIIKDTYPVMMPDGAPSRLRVLAGFYLLASQQRLPILGAAAQDHDAAELGWVEWQPRRGAE
jgi:4-amino-4-deoxy-L-arabinose transferase-like glycosyltransferase